jgi:hypothetical protein
MINKSNSFRLKILVTWATMLVLQLVLTFPIMAAGIVGDDLINPFYQFYVTGSELAKVMSYGVEAGTSHHFNVIGTIVGTFHTHFWLVFGSWFGTSHILYYQITKFLMITFSLLAAAFFLKNLLNLGSDARTSFTRIYLMVMIVFASTVQIHSLWSNDPVGNYPMSGFASVAIGFLVLGILLRYAQNPQWLAAIVLTLSIIAAILYYAINVALVVAIFVFFVLSKYLRVGYEAPVAQKAMIIGTPTVVTLLARIQTSEASANYGGATTGTLWGFFRALFNGSISSLPSSSWGLVRELIPNLLINYWQLGLLGLGVFGIVVSFSKIDTSLSRAPIEVNLKEVLLIAIVLSSYSITSVAIQAATQKYQNELPEIGYVYNFYSVTSISIAVFISALHFWLFFTHKIFGIIIQAALISMFAVQSVINWTVVNKLESVTSPSQNLISAFGSQSSNSERCLAWATWASGAWPDYYEEGMANGLSSASRFYYGIDFCDSGTRPIK